MNATSQRMMVRWVLFTFVLGAVSSLLGEESLPTRPARINLIEFLEQSKAGLPAVGTTLELEPHWVGTVQRVFLRGGEGVYRTDTPEDIRFTHLLVQEDKKKAKRVAVARLRWKPDQIQYSARYTVPLADKLPSVDVLARVTRLDELVRLFGPQHGWADGWGGFGGTNHWGENWTWFARTDQSQLRYLAVFAGVSAPSGKRGGIPQLDRTNATIDLLVIREGFFHPADPQSVEERQKFLTEDEIFPRKEAERARKRGKYPQPLRALMEAKEKPDDFEVAAYIAAINQIRANPDPELFRQLVKWMNEDEFEFSSCLEDIFFFDDDDPPPGLQRWKKNPQQAASRALIEALSEVRKPDVLEEALILVLMTQGGGKLKFTMPGTDKEIELVVGKNSNRYSTTGGNSSSEPDVAQAVAHCQTVLRKKYAKLWPH